MSDAELRLAFGGLAPARVDRLLERHGTVSGVIGAVERGWVKLNPRASDAIRVSADERRNELGGIGVEFRTADSPAFPTRLAHHPEHPRWLFTRGDPVASPAVAIVGTRACTAYGLDLASSYGSVAAAAGWSVVSGLARGIDGAAHRGAVSNGGHCHAVLGSGIDVVYPAGHRRLYREILDKGGVISSEYPPGTPPEAWRFPTRNRIIVGASDVVLVVEAGLKGGALITARIALEYGVPVYAVPGDVDRETSLGTNLLIRDGAFPILDPDDFAGVLSFLDPIYQPPK